MASVAVQLAAHPHGYLLHSHHHQLSYQERAPVIPQPQPVVAKLPPTDPYYSHEETTKICARFIRHVFNCSPDLNQSCESIGQIGRGSTFSLLFLLQYLSTESLQSRPSSFPSSSHVHSIVPACLP